MSTHDLATDTTGLTTCFLTRDMTLQPNSSTQVEFDTDSKREDGSIKGNKTLLHKGIIVMNSELVNDDKYCYVHNVTSKCIQLDRNSILAHIEKPE